MADAILAPDAAERAAARAQWELRHALTRAAEKMGGEALRLRALAHAPGHLTTDGLADVLAALVDAGEAHGRAAKAIEHLLAREAHAAAARLSREVAP